MNLMNEVRGKVGDKCQGIAFHSFQPLIDNSSEVIPTIRSIDELGRITITKEIRTKLGIKEGDKLMMSISDKKIILEKYKE